MGQLEPPLDQSQWTTRSLRRLVLTMPSWQRDGARKVLPWHWRCVQGIDLSVHLHAAQFDSQLFLVPRLQWWVFITWADCGRQKLIRTRRLWTQLFWEEAHVSPLETVCVCVNTCLCVVHILFTLCVCLCLSKLLVVKWLKWLTERKTADYRAKIRRGDGFDECLLPSHVVAG